MPGDEDDRPEDVSCAFDCRDANAGEEACIGLCRYIQGICKVTLFIPDHSYVLCERFSPHFAQKSNTG